MSETKKAVLMLASVASMIDQFNMPNIRLLLDMGVEVHVACNFREGNTCDANRLHKLREELRGMHVAVHQWDCPRDVFPVRKCGAAYRQLWELTGCFRYAWIHCHSPVGGALARMVAHRRGIRTMYTAHGFHFYQGAPVKNWLLYYPVEKLLAGWTDVLVTVNREDYCFAKQKLHAGKTFYIPGVGIDIHKLCGIGQDVKRGCFGLRKKYGIPEDALLLLSVGELSRRKNHTVVIRALAGLPEKNVYYMICGQGALQKKLMRQAEKLGVSRRVCMPGFLEDVDRVYREADIFVFPSIQEGMPVALMEAMASGMPCVVSDIRGSRELVTQEALRFAPNRPRQLQKILLQMISDPKMRDASGAYNWEKIQDYDLAIVGKQMKRIYSDFQKSKRQSEYLK